MTHHIDPYVLKVGFGCNNNCKFCFQAKRTPLFRSADSIKKELLEIKSGGFSRVVFEGGEPTLRKDIFDLVRYAKKIGFEQIDIQSNGRMFFYKEICQLLINVGITTFACSLHAHKEKIHDFLTSTPGSFKETVRGIKNLKKLNQEVGNQTVISKINYLFLPQIISFLINLGIDRLQLNFIQPVGMAAKNLDLLVPPISRIIPYVKKALEVAIKAKVYIGTMGIPYCLLGSYGVYSQEYKRAMAGGNPHKVPFKLKTIKCKSCLNYNVCEGPWIGYVRYWGWDEFRPKLK